MPGYVIIKYGTTSMEQASMEAPSFVMRGGCALCDCDQWTMHIEFPGIPVVQCTSCGFLYSQKVMSDADMVKNYRVSPAGKRFRQGQIVNARSNAWMIDRLVGVATLGSILDVGTGYGFLLKELMDKKPLAAVGVELSVRDARYGREELGLNIINDMLDESGLQKGSFDLVTALEVIEHTSQPIEFIRELAEYARPGGYVLILTDNFESKNVRELGAGFPKWIPDSHISHFSYKTLTQALEQVPELHIEKILTHVSWEVCLRNAWYKLRGIKKRPEDVFGLGISDEAGTDKKYRLFWLRKAFNRLWLRLKVTERTDGDLMYFLLRKRQG